MQTKDEDDELTGIRKALGGNETPASSTNPLTLTEAFPGAGFRGAPARRRAIRPGES
jgi:hypothetical protein